MLGTSRKTVGSEWTPPDPGTHESAQIRFARWTAAHGKSGSALSVLTPLRCGASIRTLAVTFLINVMAEVSLGAGLQQAELTLWAAVQGIIPPELLLDEPVGLLEIGRDGLAGSKPWAVFG